MYLESKVSREDVLLVKLSGPEVTDTRLGTRRRGDYVESVTKSKNGNRLVADNAR